jgi:hypothetical protein
MLLLDTDPVEPPKWAPEGVERSGDETFIKDFAKHLVASREQASTLTQTDRAAIKKVVAEASAAWEPILSEADLTPTEALTEDRDAAPETATSEMSHAELPADGQ